MYGQSQRERDKKREVGGYRWEDRDPEREAKRLWRRQRWRNGQSQRLRDTKKGREPKGGD